MHQYNIKSHDFMLPIVLILLSKIVGKQILIGYTM